MGLVFCQLTLPMVGQRCNEARAAVQPCAENGTWKRDTRRKSLLTLIFQLAGIVALVCIWAPIHHCEDQSPGRSYRRVVDQHKDNSALQLRQGDRRLLGLSRVGCPGTLLYLEGSFNVMKTCCWS